MFVPTRLILVCAVMLHAETPQIRKIDLATLQPGALKQEAVEAGKSYQFLIYHRVPGRKYQVDTLTRNIEIKPLEIGDLDKQVHALAAEISSKLTPNPVEMAHQKLADELKRAITICKESDVQGLADDIDKALADASKEAANDIIHDKPNFQDLRTKAVGFLKELNSPQVVDLTTPLKLGQEYVVTITGEPKEKCGKEDKPDAKRVWTVVYSTGERGTWDTLYGFSFSPNKDESFFSKSLDTTPATYAVTRKEGHSGYAFVPALFFTWYPKSGDGTNCTWGPTAGIGFDLKSPNAFFGMQWTFNRNFALVAGGVVRPEKRLNGKYKVGDIVKDNLSEDQLSETTFSTRFFFSLAFRFSKKPDGFGK